jgi:hypothetical protein
MCLYFSTSLQSIHCNYLNEVHYFLKCNISHFRPLELILFEESLAWGPSFGKTWSSTQPVCSECLLSKGEKKILLTICKNIFYMNKEIHKKASFTVCVLLVFKTPYMPLHLIALMVGQLSKTESKSTEISIWSI